VAVPGHGTPALRGFGYFLAKVGDKSAHGFSVGGEFFRPWIHI
jgi:hypothetical protein